MRHSYVFLPVLILLFCEQGFTQTISKKDSLKQILLSQPADTTRYITYLHLTDQWITASTDSAIFYLGLAESLALKMRDTARIAKVYRGFGYINEYLLHFDDAAACFVDSKDLYASTGDHLQVGVLYYRLANNAYHKGTYDIGLDYCDSATIFFRLAGEKGLSHLAEVKEIQGVIYQKSGNYPASLETLQEALTEWEKTGNKTGMASTYNNMGLIFLDQELDSLSLDYFHNFLRMAKEIERKDFEGIAYINLGVAFSNLDKDEFALINYEDGLKIFTDLNITSQRVLLLNNIGAVHRKAKNYKKSNEYLFQALDLIEGTDETSVRIHIYNNLGANYLDMKMPEKANYFSQKNFDLAMKFGSLSQKVEALKLRTDYAENSGNTAQAFSFQKQYMEFKDSLINQHSIQKTASIRHQFELEKRETEASLLRREQASQKTKIYIQRIFLIFFIVAMIFTMGLVFYLFRLVQFKKIAHQQLQQQAVELQTAKDLAEEASRSKAEFLSVMSHEIRTPMNAVIGMTHLLLDESPRPDQMEYLKTLKFSGTNLLNLINDILDFSKIDSGKLIIEHIDFDLHELVRGITHSLSIKAQDKNVSVDYYYDPSLHQIYNGDPVRLGQVLTNLVGNAVKFTEQGSVSIRVENTSDQGILFQVIDTGIGIPEDKQNLIFEQFSQSSSDTARKYGGTGLGLSITKKLLELMGSEIRLVSKLGKGSKFYFYLQLGTALRKVEQSSESGQEMQKFTHLEGLNILLAEDNKINQVIARKFLEKWKIRTVIVGNGKDAVEQVYKEKFDVVLMDIHMPEMDGIEATQNIRNSPEPDIASLPIIALTASALEEELKMILDAGMNDIVTKPFDPITLYQMIARYHKLEKIESAA
ncbi:MAG: ATP-binding protein [Bacteroidia bacterium]